MTSLIEVLGGPWSPPPEPVVAPPETQLSNAILNAGLTPPDEIFLDGVLRRFKSGTKGQGGHGDKTGWYVAYSDGIPAGRFGCWRSGDDHSWRADIGRKITPVEEMAHARRMAEAKARRDDELKKSREVAADTVERIYSNCGAAANEHPYLSRKGIAPNGARVTGDGRIVVPLFGPDGVLSSLQYISADGQKIYHPGGKTGGCFWWLGAVESSKRIYIAEGFATAATIFEVTETPCVVAYSASNLVPVCGTIRERYPDAQIVVVADHDASGVGQKYADQCAAKYGVKTVMPPMPGDANDYHTAGNDLLTLLEPAHEPSWLIKADEWAGQPAPISWLVKHWLQKNALIMIHGPSGGGKTFFILDMALRMAAGITDWHGHKVTPGHVVYLAGEGHHGLRGRIAAWKQVYAPNSGLTMYLSSSGCDLNLNAGLTKVVESIRALPDKPDLIIVDTLHRFMAGDENSAQDAKTMLDACAWLMGEFNCTVALAHHTGVSEDAQHRARGSSAWRGALDIEISVTPGGDHTPIGIIQRKSKDAELAQDVYLSLRSVPIKGWIDEDGEPVTSAILELADAPMKPQKDSKLTEYTKTIERAFWHAGAEMVVDAPYVSRSGFKDMLRQDGHNEAYVKNHTVPSQQGRTIGHLITAGIIQAHGEGWIILDKNIANGLIKQ